MKKFIDSRAFGVCGSAVLFKKLLPGQFRYEYNQFLGKDYWKILPSASVKIVLKKCKKTFFIL